jgi:hypothetical protein
VGPGLSWLIRTTNTTVRPKTFDANVEQPLNYIH